MSDTVTQEIQAVVLAIFKEFQRICDLHNLRYFAIGGTCIGAVRHRGFIPWDDDIDVAMPFEDYKRFTEIAKDELQLPYSVVDPYERRYYTHTIIRIQNENTASIDKKDQLYPDVYTGVFLDVMPIFGMPKGEKVQRKASHACDRWVITNAKIRLPYPKQLPLRSKVLWILLLPLKLTRPFDYFLKKIETTLGEFPFDNSDKVIFGWRKRPRKWMPGYTYQNVFFYDDFKDHLTVPFEDTTMRIPVGYDRYLTMDFGDYMKLPPKEKQISKHDFAVLDLNKSYKEYAKEGIKK